MSAISEIIKSEIGKRGWSNYSVQADRLNLNPVSGIVGKKLVVKSGFALVYKVTAEVLQPTASPQGLLCGINLRSDLGTVLHYTTSRKALFADPAGLPATPWIFESTSEILSVHEREILVESAELLSPGAILSFTNIQVLLVDKR